jgi:hypothetical protein
VIEEEDLRSKRDREDPGGDRRCFEEKKIPGRPRSLEEMV